MHDEEFSESESDDLLEEAIFKAGLDRDSAYGVAQQAQQQGEESLKGHQIYIWGRLKPYLLKATNQETVRRIRERNPD